MSGSTAAAPPPPARQQREPRAGETALHMAAANGNACAVELLVSFPETNVNIRCVAGRAPLHAAAESGCAECVAALLARADTDINARASNGVTPLMVAVTRGARACVDALLARPDCDATATHRATGANAVHLAVAGGEMTRECLDALMLSAAGRAALAGRDVYGRTPYVLASQLGYVDALQQMLDAAAPLAVD